jgi:TRAP-type C4-dicarboxylate transport system substrate-binding protein
MRALLAAAVVLFAAGSAWAGSGEADAGRRTAPVPKPVVLTLATGDEASAAAYAAAVARLSGGTLRIQVRVGRGAQADYERFTVEDVRKGKAQLGSVGARVWDTLGVESFRALLAPLLVDSLVLQRRVLESPLSTGMLAGLDRADVVGLALLPGPLRRPLGVTRALTGARDYRGAAIGIKYGGVARAALAALGARAKGYTLESWRGARLDGAELDARTIEQNRLDEGASALTANVVLWPRPQTVFAAREAFARLTSAQQEILRRAGRATRESELARVRREQRDALEVLCARSPDLLVDATAANLAGLREAVSPVYAELERDAGTRARIASIRRLRDGAHGPEALRCPAAAPASPAELEGTWATNATAGELLAAGASAPEAATYAGSTTLSLAGSGWVARGERATVSGTYAVDGSVLRLTMRTCTSNPCSPGTTTEYAWRVDGGALSLARRPGHEFWPLLVVKPLAKVA